MVDTDRGRRAFTHRFAVTNGNVAPTSTTGSHVSLSDPRCVIDPYAFTPAAPLTAGSPADLWGARRCSPPGTVAFAAGSSPRGLATDPLLLSLAAAGQGMHDAARFATSLALVARDDAPGR
jgi:hypothetical protein